MKTSSTPASSKSSSAVSIVRLVIGFSPRAYITASALAISVPPTQKPSALICLAPVISCIDVDRLDDTLLDVVVPGDVRLGLVRVLPRHHEDRVALLDR